MTKTGSPGEADVDIDVAYIDRIDLADESHGQVGPLVTLDAAAGHGLKQSNGTGRVSDRAGLEVDVRRVLMRGEQHGATAIAEDEARASLDLGGAR